MAQRVRNRGLLVVRTRASVAQYATNKVAESHYTAVSGIAHYVAISVHGLGEKICS